jgi:hypothetical protein
MTAGARRRSDPQYFPPTGCLSRALDTTDVFIDAPALLGDMAAALAPDQGSAVPACCSAARVRARQERPDGS